MNMNMNMYMYIFFFIYVYVYIYIYVYNKNLKKPDRTSLLSMAPISGCLAGAPWRHLLRGRGWEKGLEPGTPRHFAGEAQDTRRVGNGL